MLNKKIISAIMAGMMVIGSVLAPSDGVINNPFAITVSAATTSQIQQLQSDITTITNHIQKVSYLQRGKASNTSSVVCAYQRILNTLYGAGLVVDGIFGPAVESFSKNVVQKGAGITADGIVGVGTLKVIKAKADTYIAQNTSASITFGSMVVPPSITEGDSYNLGGAITSSGAVISSFKGEILSGSTVVMAKTVYPNAYSVNIRSSAVNTALAFGKLAGGQSYTLKYTVIAGSTTKTYSQSFSVQAKKAVITFSSMTAPSSLTKGSSYALSGTIKTTNQPIYSITAQIKSGSSTVLSKTVYPNSYSYSLKGSALDSALKFGSLSAGSFSLVYSVVAKDGTTSTKTYSFNVTAPATTVTTSATGFAAKLIQAAQVDIGKTSAQMGFPSGQNWCAYSVGKWLKNIGVDLGTTANVNSVVETLIGSNKYSATAYVFRDYKGNFTSGNLYNLYGGSKVQKIEDRYSVTPQPGDIICYKWKTETNYENYSHIGIVVSYDPSTKTIVTIEGNAGSGTVSTRRVTLFDGTSNSKRAYDNQVVALVRFK